jgi:hypothetical protein
MRTPWASERDRIDLVALIVTQPARRQAHHRLLQPAFLRDQFLDGMVHAVRVRAVAQRDRVSPLSTPLRHHFSTIDVQHDIYRTVYNQYDSRSCRS